jgi:hypothetical protein
MLIGFVDGDEGSYGRLLLGSMGLVEVLAHDLGEIDKLIDEINEFDEDGRMLVPDL